MSHAVRQQRPDHVSAIKARLTDPRAVCEKLGLLTGATRQGGGLLVRCPAHGDRTPSCSVTRGRDKTLRVRCFGCAFSGDVFHLIAARLALDVRTRFQEVLAHAAVLAGVSLDDGAPPPRPARPPPRLSPVPERPYPPTAQVVALWAACQPVPDDHEVAACLEARGLDPDAVETFDVARALPRTTVVPRWARFGDHGWTETGHRLVVAMYDAEGVLRSVRAWRVTDNETPKRLPPTGYRASGLVMADALGRRLLASGAPRGPWPSGHPRRAVVVEGEPDFVTWATRFSDANETATAVFGIVAGSWTDQMATRIPDGTRVLLRTDADAAGDRMAEAVRASLADRCHVKRSSR
jgi:DNA primase